MEQAAELGRLLAELPTGVVIKHTPVLNWHMEIQDKESGVWFYNGCFDNPLDMLRDYYKSPYPKLYKELEVPSADR